ncbi:hypothetical protein RTM1035_19996 [Roseovarius sp. TM1035]|uniref:hypothetical protein n=1 Tax=Roseovarius TaxID=74030 RepID=UPI00015567A9|nr:MULTISPECIES: hypothetical protein [Roseovarius]AWZ20127.1 Hypothetical protein RAK1035_1416 [Roseovarius sp. AK1035]EDM31642.1 hypothetical protein RTM1035_19996 [Roseovarius sp. TM1035]VVT15719.1 conserved hypothetical protein [Roseovarius sp. EC-SD190]
MPGSASDLLVKVVIFFLVAMGVLAMFGRLRFPGQKRLSQAKCQKCGRYRIGKGPCSCEKGKLK